MEDLGRREMWPETVNRYCNWAFRNPKIPDKVKSKTKDKILNLHVLPSMRALWTAGKAADEDNAVIYNCAYLNADSLDAFGTCLYLLMCGTGVGYSVENKHVGKLPQVQHQKNASTYTHVVQDSRLGWKLALDKGIESWWSGRDVTFDFSCLRPMGAPLRTMGGRSSGGDVLRDLLQYARELIFSCQGRYMSSMDVHNLMCQIASVVIVGGTRRSALISLSDLSDVELRNCKSGTFHPRLYGANNSAVYYEKPKMLTFLDEWVALAKSGSGERGIANLWAARKNAPSRRKGKLIEGMNPCFAGHAKILTDAGYKRFDELADESGDAFTTKIINIDGVESDGLVWCSGRKECVDIIFMNPRIPPIRCTPDHKFMLNDGSSCLAKDLTKKRLMPYYSIKRKFDTEKFLAGFMQCNGKLGRLEDGKDCVKIKLYNKHSDIADMYGQKLGVWNSVEAYEIAKKYDISDRSIQRWELPDSDIVGDADFLAGLFSINGRVTIRRNGNGFLLLHSNNPKFLQKIKRVLKNNFDIKATVNTAKKLTRNHTNGKFTSKAVYQLLITEYNSMVAFAKHISFGQKSKQNSLERLVTGLSPAVVFIKPVGVHPVYDFNEPIVNWGIVEGFVASNCAEVTLRDSQFCNLTEVIVRPEDDFESLRDKVTTAAWLGTIQSSFDYFPALDSAWHENAVDERLVGISLSGQMDNPSLLSAEILKLLRQHATNTCRKASKALGINMPASCTTVKPAGTTSTVVNSSAGIHLRYAPYYIRNIMIATTDPLYRMMQSQGAPIFIPQTNGKNSAVIRFPVASPSNAITRYDMSAIEQLDWYHKIVTNWTDMNASATIYVDQDEWLSVANWVYDHFEHVNGLTFFPKQENESNYEWTPFQEIKKDEYEALLEKFPRIDYTKLSRFETEDNTIGAKEFACAGGKCDI
jgi:ribonucleotide reductase alpha subunit